MSYDDIMKRADDAVARENFDYAIALLIDIVVADPKQRKARHLLRQAEIRKLQRTGRSTGARISGFLKGLTSRISKKDPLKAVAQMENSLKDDPGNIALMIDLAEQLRAAMMVDQAIDTLEMARELDNLNKNVLRNLVYYYEEINDFGKAQLRAQEFCKIDPNDKEMSAKLKDVSAKRHIELSRVDKAKSFRDQLIDEEKARDLEKGQRLVRSDDEISAAIRATQAAIAENPEDAVQYTKLGDLLVRQDSLEEAMQAYKRAFNLNKEYLTREKMGDLKIRMNNKAIEAAQKAVEANPGDAEAARRLTEVKKVALKFSLEEFAFRVKTHPTDLGLRYRLGVALMQAGQIDRAVQEFQQTVTDPKVKTRSQWNLGLCFMQKGLADLAVNQYKAALASPGVDSETKKGITYNLGEAYEEMGQVQEARNIYQQIFEVDIGYKDVADKVTKLRSSG